MQMNENFGSSILKDKHSDVVSKEQWLKEKNEEGKTTCHDCLKRKKKFFNI